MDPEQPLQLVDRARVLVDAEVDERVGEPSVAAVALDDEQRRRLLPASVASRSLRRGEAAEQPLGERPAGGRLDVSASAATVSAETRMLPCAAYPSPPRPPPRRGRLSP